jgi:rhodanese-related sulfurtransferase
MSPDTNDGAIAPAVRQLSVAEAHALAEAGRGVLVDTRGRNLYENAHAAGAISLPLSEIEAAHGRIAPGSVPSDRFLILYCA